MPRAADHELSADLVLQIPHLAAQRRLRRVQPLRGGNRQTALLGDGYEIPKMPELHSMLHERSGPAFLVALTAFLTFVLVAWLRALSIILVPADT
jgi:hypothetical protein